jgi:hypothetical protein
LGHGDRILFTKDIQASKDTHPHHVSLAILPGYKNPDLTPGPFSIRQDLQSIAKHILLPI